MLKWLFTACYHIFYDLVLKEKVIRTNKRSQSDKDKSLATDDAGEPQRVEISHNNCEFHEMCSIYTIY